MNILRATSWLAAAIAVVAAVSPARAKAASITGYEVTGEVQPYCSSSNNNECQGPANNYLADSPILGDFSFWFDLGGDGYFSSTYSGGPDFTSSFAETLNLRDSAGFQIQATYPVPDVDGFPSFDALQSVDVTYTPACSPPACAPGQIPNEDELIMTAAIQLSSYVVEMDLYFENGDPITGTLDLTNSQFLIEDSGNNLGLWNTYFMASAALTVAPTPTPEPGSLAFSFLGLALTAMGCRGRARRMRAASGSLRP